MFQFLQEQIPIIDPNRRYWFIRTYGGEIFNEFYKNNYVGLGVNNVPQRLIQLAKPNDIALVQQLHNFVERNTPYQKGQATRIVNDLISFQHEVKVGDLVVIPNKYSSRLAIGEIESDVRIVNHKRTFSFNNKPTAYPEKRRNVKWDRIVYREDLSSDLKTLISSHYGLTNADKFADILEGTVESLYIKRNYAYFTLKINQDEDINAFVFNKFLTGLTYFYHEFAKENGEDTDEELYIKIKLQSKGTTALKALSFTGMFGIATMIALSGDTEVKLRMGQMEVEGKSRGLLESWSDFLDEKQERKMKYEEFQDSMQQLQVMRYDDSLRLKEDLRNNPKREGEK